MVRRVSLIGVAFGCLAPALAGAAGEGGQEMKYGVGTWSGQSGNHRAVVRVPPGTTGSAVRVHIPWRRRDLHPEWKATWVVDAATARRVENVVRVNVNRQFGDLVFQPTSGPGEYWIYYMPFRTEGWWAFPSIRYIAPKSTAQAAWLAQHKLQTDSLAGGAWKALPQARVTELQAINEFHRFDPMEVVATAAEVQAFVASLPKGAGQVYVLFPEDRKYPIRMTDELPLRWVRPGTRYEFRGEAMRGEFYAFQIGVYALSGPLEALAVEFSDLRGPEGETIPASELRCFNLGGVDCLGRPMHKTVGVPKGKVQALWFGVQVPKTAAAGGYTGTVTVEPANAPPATVKLALAVSNKVLADGGDAEPWRHSRLRWLDSTIGLDDEVYPPYTPVKLADRTVHVLGRSLRFGPTGLPESIASNFSVSVDAADSPAREILAGGIRFVAADARGAVAWRGGEPQASQAAPGAVQWQADSKARGLELHVRAKMECDGYVNYYLTVKATQAGQWQDMALEVPVRRDVARYMMGLGRKGGLRPQSWTWNWDVTRSNSYVWLGDANAGLQCKLKHVWPDWSLYGLHNTGIYRDWGNGGKGGCTVAEDGDAVVFRAFTGPRSLAVGQELHFNFALLITPVKVLDKGHWRWRYFHSGAAHPVAEVAKTGATVINLHQGDKLNPHINYPFRTAEALAQYARQAHQAGMKVKIYYTVRELSDYCWELWALRSLGDEVFPNGPGFRLADHFRKDKPAAAAPRTGDSWLCEHAIDGYVPAWHQPLGNGHCDAAIAQTGLSRWHNYYLQGLGWLAGNVGIDGLYLDGIGYDREIMKRVRKVLLRARPGCLIDFHSGNNFHANYGLNNVAGQYMELFPCLDSLWFGEGFDYHEPPDYWLVEISGIPFGLFGEMLHGGGNCWRGMVYGMTSRLGWSGDPRAVWKAWDEFGIDKARMIGYWDPACPVKTGRDDVLATAYVRDRKALIALASWAPKPVPCKLKIDLEAIGLDQAKAHLWAPPIDNYQPAALFKTTDAIPVHPGRGWLLVLDDQPHEVPAQTENPYAGRKALLEDRFEGKALGKDWTPRLSARVGTRLKVADGALRVEAAANSFAFAQRPLPAGAAMVSCLVRQDTDGGASWGPGLALVWKTARGETALRVNVRAEGRFGVYGYKGEILQGSSFPDDTYTIVIRLEAKSIVVQASADGKIWQALATIPRNAFPGEPVAVRVGKMGLGAHDRDFGTPGPAGSCQIRDLRVLGPAQAKRP